ncbi:MAG: 5'-methylthioadenosine/S-adenosylhomocysteine nucleosidase [Bdellovibrionales bacterium]|nr:5'-methylthioadenosine/S-adenosylhomocysteine nucleosidase [Bdellovibrionales bacterium]
MILILTPLKMEHDALATALGADSTGRGPGFALAVGGHGKVQFALTTQHLVRELKPRLVLCVGASGALNPKVAPLDVVVGEETIEHDFRMRFVQKPSPLFAGCAQSLQKLKTQSFAFNVHFGRIASGDEDVIEESRAAELAGQTQALSVAWEGAGGARACRFLNVPFLEVRVVTDGANAQAPRDFSANVKQGMRHAAQVIQTLL